MNQVEHARGKDQNERAEEQADVQVQVTSDEIEASHQEKCDPDETIRGVGATVSVPSRLTAPLQSSILDG